MLKNINELKNNEANPRTIADDKFEKLVKSLKEFPEMLKLRPIVVDEDMTVLGGNMRLKACKEAGINKVHVTVAQGLTEEQKKEFIIKDNVGFGQWDWELLSTDTMWNELKLEEWGLKTWDTPDVDLEDFFEENTSESTEEKNKIILEYSQEDFEKITEKFNSFKGSKESIVWELLGL